MTSHSEHHSFHHADSSIHSPSTGDPDHRNRDSALGGLQLVDGGGLSNSSLRVAVIERRSLVRECLIRSLVAATGWNVVAFDTAAAWLSAGDQSPASLVVLCLEGTGAASDTDPDVALLAEVAARAPIALMADSEDPSHIVAALGRSVRGYIPTSLPFHVAVEAMRLVRAGGVYVPASSLIASQKRQTEQADEKPKATSLFTSRQIAVITALRKGKANKIIAFELNMRESTVKVHVRNIMKKLKARNRTEVAYLANSMLSGDPR